MSRSNRIRIRDLQRKVGNVSSDFVTGTPQPGWRAVESARVRDLEKRKELPLEDQLRAYMRVITQNGGDPRYGLRDFLAFHRGKAEQVEASKLVNAWIETNKHLFRRK